VETINTVNCTYNIDRKTTLTQ